MLTSSRLIIALFLILGFSAQAQNQVINDSFDDGDLFTNSTGVGIGFNSVGQTTITESSGFMNVDTQPSGANTMVAQSKNTLNPFQTTPTTLTWQFGTINRDTTNGQRLVVGYRLASSSSNHFLPGTQGIYIGLVSNHDGPGSIQTNAPAILAITNHTGTTTEVARWTWGVGTSLTNLTVKLVTTNSTYALSFTGATPNMVSGSLTGNLTALGTVTNQFTTAIHNQYWGTSAQGGAKVAAVSIVINSAPTDITLTPSSIAENNTAGAAVGNLAAVDADAGDTHTFSLVAGVGDTDNGSFTIVGNSLRLNAVADFETKNSYSVRVQANDGNTGTFAKALTVTITDVNEAPTVASISPTSGPSAGGTSVTITGTNFISGATVTIGGAAASNVVVNSSTSITCTTPAGSAGARNVVVTVSAQPSTGGTGLFTYNSTPPLGTNGSAVLAANGTYTFTPASWGFSDPGDSPPNNFVSVKITGLPSVGTLTAGGSPVTLNQVIPVVPGPVGSTWTTNGNASGIHNWWGLASSTDGSRLVAITTDEHIYTSTDGGLTWSTNGNSSGVQTWRGVTSSADGLKLAACTGNNGFAGTNDCIHTSVNGGLTWTRQTGSGVRAWHAIDSSSDGTTLIACELTGYLYTSVDGGVTWTSRTVAGSRAWRGVAVAADGTKMFACDSGNGYIYSSSDSGVTWTTNGNSSGQHFWNSITCSADGLKLAACDFNNGYIYTSSNGGLTWTTNGNSSGLNAWFAITSSSDGSKLAACANGSYVYTSTNSGLTWTQQTSSGTAYRSAIAMSGDGSKLMTSIHVNYISFSPGAAPSMVYTAPSSVSGSPYATLQFAVVDDGTSGFNTATTSAAFSFNEPPPPTVASISPSSGPSAGGTNVTITGTNFASGATVTVGGAAASNVVVNSSTSITCTTPAGSAGTASVVVATAGGTNAPNTLYTYVAPPTVTSVSPSSGSILGGTSVTLTGTNFTGVTAVTIGGAAATSVVVDSATQITCTTPAGAAGTASVLVTATGGTNTANTLYSYVTVTPVVSSPTSSGVTRTTARISGNITSDGGEAITERGVILSTTATNPNPLMGGIGVLKIVSAGTTGAFTVPVTGLVHGTRYSYKVYAINSLGTSYSSAGTFITGVTGDLFLPGHTSQVVYRVTRAGVVSTFASSLGNTPVGAAFDSAGNLYVSVLAADKIIKFTSSGGVLSNVPSNFATSGVTRPYGLAIDSADNLFVARREPGIVSKITPAGVVTDFATGVTGTQGLAFDAVGSLYATSNTGNVVKFISTDGVLSNVSAIHGSCSSTDLNHLTFDSIGNLFVTNRSSGIINKFTATAGELSTTSTVFSSTGSTSLLGVAFDSAGQLYLADMGASAIKKFTPAAVSSTFASGLSAPSHLAFQTITPTAPTVTTPTYASITASRATLGGNVTSDGDGLISERGIVYSVTSVNGDPVIGGTGVTKVAVSGAIGVFTQMVTGLIPSTGYSFKAYATNGVDTSYSSVNTFTTLSNATPTNITLTPDTIAENNAANATVGTLAAVDADVADTHTFTLVAGAGDDDNGSFIIDGTTLKMSSVADFEAQDTYSIRVQADDGNTGIFAKELTVTITDVNEAPTLAAISKSGLEDSTLTFSAADFTGAYSDPENDALTSITVASLPASGALKLSGVDVTASQVIPAANLANLTYVPVANENGTETFTLLASDGSLSSSPVTTVTMTIAKVNDAPSFTLSGGSTVHGETWVPGASVQPWFAVSSSADGNKLAAGSYGGLIHTSTDGGTTWTAQTGSGNHNWNSIASSADGMKLAAAAAGQQIYTSGDGGVSWTARESNRNWHSIACSADGSKLAAVNQGGKIYTSTDSGVTWTAQEQDRNWFSIASSSDGVKLAAVELFGQIYTSTDSGATWTARESSRTWVSITSSADGAKLAALDGGGQIYTSADSGVTWTPRETNRSWRAITSSADGTHLAAIIQGGRIYTSRDSGVTWVAKESVRQWVDIASSADGSKLVAPEYIGQVYTSVGTTLPSVVTVAEDAGSVSFANLATNISAGPANESAQTVSFTVTNDNNGLFSEQPAIDAGGTLTFTAADQAHGIATVSVTAVDNGGTLNGGVDTSAAQTFSLIVTSVNDVPTDITLTPASIVENNAANATVGTLAAVDADPADTHIFTLVAGTGDGDNSSFTIDGTELKLNLVADFETKSSYSLRVQANDGNGGLYAKAMTVSITDANDTAKLVIEQPVTVTRAPGSRVTFGTIPAISGNALKFDGSNDNVSIPRNAALDAISNTYTFESWIRVAGYQYGTFISKFEDDGNNRGWMVNMGETGDATKLCVVHSASGDWVNPISWNSGWTPALNTWYHVAVVFDATLASNEIKLYVNGTLQAQTSWAYNLVPNNANLYLGGYDGFGNGLNAGADSRFFNGSMDDVRVWNIARTQAQIQADYLRELAGTETGLVGYWKLNQGVAGGTNTGVTTVTAQVGNNGTLVNSALTGTTSNWVQGNLNTAEPYLAEFTLRNPGVLPLTITDVNVSGGNAADFALDTASMLTTIAPGESTTFTVTFLNSSTGTRTTTLNVLSNDPANTTYSILLRADNFVPTNITLTPASLAELNAAGASVGILAAVDADLEDDVYSFSLVAGTGDTDNASFTIDGNTLKITPVTNYEVKNAYALRVQVTDGRGGVFAKALTVNITDVNEPVTDILASNGGAFNENIGSNAVAVTLTAVDPDLVSTHVFSLVSGVGDTDNSSFYVSGNQLRTVTNPDYELKTSYAVRVRVNDGLNTFEKAFTLNVINLNEAPTDITLSNAQVVENDTNLTVGTLAAVEPDAGQTHTFTLVSGAGSGDNALFNISGNTLRLNSPANYEFRSAPSVRIRATDNGTGALFFEKAFTISVTDLQEPPYEITFTGSAPAGILYASGLTARMVYATGNITGLAYSDNLLNGVNVASQFTGPISYVDFADGNTNGRFPGVLPYPGRASLTNADNFVLNVTGTIIVPTTGIYTFAVRSDDGSRIKIDGVTVFADDTFHGENEYYTPVNLTAGPHSLDFLFFEGGGGAQVELFVAAGSHGSYNGAFSLLRAYPLGINENTASGSQVAALGASDDAGNTHTFELVSGTGATDNASFSLSTSGLLTTNFVPDFETKATYSIRVRATDNTAQTYEQVLTVNIFDINETPSAIALTNANVYEHNLVGSTVGTFSTTDVDAAQTFTYTLVSGTGSTNNNLFSISGNTLMIQVSADYETLIPPTYSVRVRSTDQGGLFTEQNYTINIMDANDPATDITLSNAQLDENNVAGVTVGTLTTTDPNPGQTHTYTLVSGTGSTDNVRFSITGNELKLLVSANYEVQPSYSVRIRTTDNGAPANLWYEKAFTITINGVNEAPGVTSALVYEITNPTRVGSSIAYNIDNSLVYGAVPFNRVRYRMEMFVGGVLRYADTSFEPWAGLNVAGLRVPDGTYPLVHKRTVSNMTVESNYPGVVNASGVTGALELWPSNYSTGLNGLYDYDDDGYGSSVGYGSFQVHNMSSVPKQTVFAWNQHGVVNPDIGFGNQVGGSGQPDWTFSNGSLGKVGWKMQVYIGAGINSYSIPENNLPNVSVGNAYAYDEDAGDGLSYEIVAGVGDTDNALFYLDGIALKTSIAFDYETKNTYSVRLRATDLGGLSTEYAVTISVQNVNETPTDIALSSATIPENNAVNATVGNFTTTDVDALDSFTYTLVAGAGSTDNASFNISANALRLSVATNYEAKSLYNVRIRSTDAGGLWVEKPFVVTITDANDAPHDITLTPSSIAENEPVDSVVGTLVAFDQDPTHTHTFSLVSGTGSTDNASFEVDGSNLKIKVSANFEVKSSYAIRVRATDDGSPPAFYDEAMTVSITNVNEAPTISDIANRAINEDTSTGLVAFTIGDVDAGTTFQLTAVSSNTTLVPDGNIAFSGTGTSRYLLVSPAADLFGSTDITVTVSDGVLSASDTFTLTVNSSNDAPSFTLSSTELTQIGATPTGGNGYAVGTNGYGQLAAGSGIIQTSTVVNMLNVTDFTQVQAGDYGGIGLRPDGTVWVWGRNEYGQLANGIASDSNPSFVPIQVAGLTNVVEVDAAFGWFAVRKSDGTVWAWGRNDFGCLGQGTTSGNSTTPVQVIGLSNVTDIMIGGWGAMALTSTGTVYTWGRNDNGQLGRGTVGVSSGTATAITSLTGNVAKLFDSTGYTCFVEKTDGTVWAWGKGDLGGFGDGRSGGGVLSVVTPFQVTNLGISQVRQLCAGYSFTVAAMMDGTVKVWGDNADGRLGLGYDTGGIHATPVTVPGLANITQVWSVLGSGYALRADGRVWEWGHQNGFSPDSYNTPMLAAGLTNIRQISAGQGFMLAVGNPPSPTIGFTVAEDSVPGTIPLLVDSFSPGPVDELGQAVSFLVTNNNNALFSTQPAISTDGTLTYALATNANGSAVVSVRARDNGGTANAGVDTSEPKLFTIVVTPVNDTPTALALSAATVAENSAINTTVGTLSTTDIDAAETFTYTLVSGSGDEDNASFNISSTSLRTSAVFDFETKSSYNIRVRTTDSGGLFFENTFVVSVTNVNEAPVDLALDSTSIAENVAANSTVGLLSTVDNDAANTFTYTLVSGAGSTDNASFNISGAALRITSSPNFEAKSSYAIRVRTTDQGGLFYEEAITISINDVNEAPTNITLGGSAPSGNLALNKPVIRFSSVYETNLFSASKVTDGSTTDIFGSNYWITPDSQGVGAFFTLDLQDGYNLAEIKLRNTNNTQYNDRGTGGFRILASNSVNASNELISPQTILTGTLTQGSGTLVSFTNLNGLAVGTYRYLHFIVDSVAPWATGTGSAGLNEIEVYGAVGGTITENNALNATISTLSATDVDAASTHTFALVGGAGDTDNASFTISGNQLLSAAVFDYETKNSYSVRVRVTDSGGLFFEKALTVAVTNVNEAPSALALAGSSVNENVAANTTVGTFSSTDVDAGNTFTYSLVAGTGDTHNSQFNISASTLRANAGLNFEAGATRSIRVRTTDQGGLWFEQVFTITINDVNEMPSFTLTGNDRVPFSTATSQTKAAFVTNINDGDSEVTQTLTFIVTNNNNGIFSVQPALSSTGTLTYTPNGTAGVATVTVSLTDDNSINGTAALTTATQTFTITVDPSPDYHVVTTPTTLTITNLSNTSDTLSFSNGGTFATFAASGRTFSLNGALNLTGSIDLPYASLAGINSITINAAGGNDIVNIGDFSAVTAFPGLTINGGNGDDTINLNGDIAFSAGNHLDLDLQNDHATPGIDTVNVAANANLITSGTGAITVRASKNIAMASGSSFEAVNGNLTVEANQQATPTTGGFVGVDLNNALIKSTGTGTVSVLGKGGTTGADQVAVRVRSGGDIIGGTTGTLTVTGLGGISTGNQNYGVQVVGSGSTINSTGAHVTVNGTGGAASSASFHDRGVVVELGGRITSGVTGNVSVTGTGPATGHQQIGVYMGDGSTIDSAGGNVSVTGYGGTGTSGECDGVFMDFGTNLISAGGSGTVTVVGTAGGSATAQAAIGVDVRRIGSSIRSSGGNVSVTGTGGTSNTTSLSGNAGVRVMGDGLIAAGGAGTTTVVGTGGSASGIGAEGVVIDGLGFNSNLARIGAANGTTTVTATAGNTSSAALSVGIQFAGRITTSTNNDIIINADSVNLGSNATISSGTGSTTIKQRSSGARIALGGADVLNGSPLTLGLTDAELDLVTAGILTIGDSSSGNVTMSTALSPANVTTLNIVSGGTINDANSSGTDITVANASTTGGLTINGSSPGTLSVSGNHTLGANSSFNVELGGLTAGTQFDQLTAPGAVNIGSNVTLNVASFGGYMPSVATTYVIINRTGGTGTFAGLPEGGVIATDFLATGKPGIITYRGGDGDDVMIIAANPNIQIEQPVDSILVEAVSTVDFGTRNIAATSEQTFTVRNTGTSDLTLSSLNITGTHASDFAVTTAPGSMVLAPNATTTFAVTFTPSSNLSRTALLTVASNDLDEANFRINLQGFGNFEPTDITLTSATVPENSAAGITVGLLGSVDADSGQTYSYSLVSGAGSTDNAFFAINGAALKIMITTDFESKSFYYIRLRTLDNLGGSFEKALVIAVLDMNDAPEITINDGAPSAAYMVDEHTTFVTSVTAFDIDTPFQRLEYSISGADAALFEIQTQTGQLSFKGAPDYEAPLDANLDNVYQVNVIVTDDGTPNLSASQALSVIIRDLNDAPVIVSHGGAESVPLTVAENTTAVTTVVAEDEDVPAQTLTYSIVGGADASRFAINPATGVLTFINAPDADEPLDQLGDNTYYVMVCVTDDGDENLTDKQEFVVSISNINEVPTDIVLSAASIDERNAINAVIGSFSSSDPDHGQAHAYSLVSGTGGADNASFTINGASLSINVSAVYATKSSYSIRVRSTDNGSPPLSFEKVFTISIIPAGTTPLAVTEVATAVTVTTGTMNAKVTPNEIATTAWFTYGTDPTLSSDTITTPAQSVGAGKTAVTITRVLTGLLPETVYYYRVSAENLKGTTTGIIRSFQTSYEIASDTIIPGAPSGNVTLLRPLPGPINQAGKITFSAMAKTGVNGITTAKDSVLISTASGGMRVVGQEGTAVPGGGTLVGSFTHQILTEAGQAVTLDRMLNSVTTKDYAYFVSPDGLGLEVLSREGDLVTGGGTFMTHTGKPAADASERLYFQGTLSGVLATKNTGVWYDEAGDLLNLAKEGANYASITGDPAWLGNFQAMISAEGDGAAFIAALQNNPDVTTQKTATATNLGIFSGAPGSLSMVARKGHLIPSVGKLGTFSGLSRNSLGDHAFISLLSVSTVAPVVSTSNDQVLMAEIGGSLHVVARENTTPIVSTLKAARFGNFQITSQGEVIFMAWLAGSGVTTANDGVLCRWTQAGGIELLAREGSLAPGAGLNYGIFQVVSVSPGGAIALQSTLSTGISLMRALPGGVLDKVVKNAENIVLNGTPRSILTLSIHQTGAGTGGGGGGMGSAINDEGEVFTVLSLSGGFYVGRVYP